MHYQRVLQGEAHVVRVSESFGKQDALVAELSCFSGLARKAEHHRPYRMRAHAGVVTAEHGAHPCVPGRIVLPDAFLRVLERRWPLAPEESGGPAAMEGFELQIGIGDLPAERDQLLGPVARNFELAAGNGVVPESPCVLEQPDVIARSRSRLMR